MRAKTNWAKHFVCSVQNIQSAFFENQSFWILNYKSTVFFGYHMNLPKKWVIEMPPPAAPREGSEHSSCGHWLNLPFLWAKGIALKIMQWRNFCRSFWGSLSQSGKHFDDPTWSDGSVYTNLKYDGWRASVPVSPFWNISFLVRVKKTNFRLKLWFHLNPN